MSKIKRGQYRLNCDANEPIQILSEMAGIGEPYRIYRVRDLRGRKPVFLLTNYSIGPELTEMEVIAWASK